MLVKVSHWLMPAKLHNYLLKVEKRKKAVERAKGTSKKLHRTKVLVVRVTTNRTSRQFWIWVINRNPVVAIVAASSILASNMLLMEVELQPFMGLEAMSRWGSKTMEVVWAMGLTEGMGTLLRRILLMIRKKKNIIQSQRGFGLWIRKKKILKKTMYT